MKKQIVSVVGSILTVEYPSINKKFTADISKYPASIQADAQVHGFKQKFGDAESGKSPAEKYAMVQRIHENLTSGNWELVSNPDHSGIIIEAICRLKGLKESQVRKAVEKDETKLKEWASNLKVKAEVAKIRAERAAKAAEETDDETELDFTV